MKKTRKARAEDSSQLPHPAESHESFQALDRLRGHPRVIITEVIPRIIRDFANDESLPAHEKRAALSKLFQVLVSSMGELRSKKARPRAEIWKERDRTRKETPFSFASRAFAEEISTGKLTKSTIRQADFSLYRALCNLHWKSEVESEKFFAKLPSKKETTDKALESLSVGSIYGALNEVIPEEIQEQLRLLRVLQMRKHRASKR